MLCRYIYMYICELQGRKDLKSVKLWGPMSVHLAGNELSILQGPTDEHSCVSGQCVAVVVK